MEDLLMQSALAYRDLMHYRYHFTLGFKGKVSKVSVEFPAVAFYHLAGLHKMGFTAVANKKKALNVILAGELSANQVIKAGYHMEDRWRGICELKDMIEKNQAVFRYRGHEQSWSEIRADYLMCSERAFFFIANGCPTSIFGRGDNHYEIGCPCLKTLLIHREEIESGCKEEIYRSESYREIETE